MSPLKNLCTNKILGKTETFRSHVLSKQAESRWAIDVYNFCHHLLEILYLHFVLCQGRSVGLCLTSMTRCLFSLSKHRPFLWRSWEAQCKYSTAIFIYCYTLVGLLLAHHLIFCKLQSDGGTLKSRVLKLIGSSAKRVTQGTFCYCSDYFKFFCFQYIFYKVLLCFRSYHNWHVILQHRY